MTESKREKENVTKLESLTNILTEEHMKLNKECIKSIVRTFVVVSERYRESASASV